MYYDYFGLKQPPFRITPDTNLFFPGGERGAILDALVFAVINGEGIIKVVGEVGSGKTMLCRMLQKELPASVEVVYLANPSLSPENILHAIAFELKLPVDADSSKLLVMHQIQEYLLDKHARNQQVVVFVEEAQGMPLATMEEIRLLSNLETNQNKLLQIILFGQPELDQMIAQRNIRQLRERITYSFQLNPFKSTDIKEYINARLRSCGYRADDLFSDSAVRTIARYSNGLVRRVNILADKSMLAAYASNTNRITAKHVRQAARDSEFMSGRLRYWLPSSVALVLLTGAAFYWGIPWKTATESSPVKQDVVSSISKGRTGAAVMPAGRSPASAQEMESSVRASVAQTVNNTPPVSGKLPSGIEETREESGEKKVVLQLSDYLEKSHGENISQPTPEIEPAEGELAFDGMKEDKEELAVQEIEEEKAELVIEGMEEGKKEVSSQSYQQEDGLEGQLIGLREVFRLQDIGDSRLTDQERSILRQQLKLLPPEEAVSLDSSVTGDECKLCWSIIYRPLIESGNL